MTDQPRKLLIRGVNWLGDAVMTTPALMRLREALPDAHISLLTRAKLADLWKSHPAIDEVIEIQPGESVWGVGCRLRSHGFDTALVLPNSPRSALEVWWGRIPRRIGYARPWRNLFLTETISPRSDHVKMRKRAVAEIRQLTSGANLEIRPAILSESAHQMHDYLHLAKTLGASGNLVPPRLGVTPEEVEVARTKFRLPSGGLWLGVNPGAEYGPAKRWPVDRFVATAQAVQDRLKCGVIVFGGGGDKKITDEIVAQIGNQQLPVINLAGRTSLRELMALLTQCRVLLTNDTGPMHVAAALGVPVVVPFGSTSPELTGPGLPGGSKNRLLKSGAPCSPCFLRECPIDFRCMRGISVKQVVDAVIEVMSASPEPI